MQLPAHAREVKRALLDRLEDLKEELADLSGKQLSGDGAADESLGDRGADSGVAARAFLQELQSYPDWMRRRIEYRTERATRPGPLIQQLRKYSAEVVAATSSIQEWFASPHSGDIPTALDRAVQETLGLLGIPHRQGILTTGRAHLDTVVTDARQDVFQKDSAESFGEEEAAGPTYAVLRVPTHEASSPRWWPVVIGHELAHQKISEDEQRSRREDSGDDKPRPHPEIDLSSQQIFILDTLGILAEFPIDEMGRVVEDELARRSGSQPLPGLGAISANASQAPTSPSVASRIVVANAWVEEVICDLVMVRRFGPAGVAAMANYLVSVGNYTLVSSTHPPGFFRVGMMLAYLGSTVPPDFATVLDPWRVTRELQAKQHPPPPWVQVIFTYMEQHQDAIFAHVDTWPGERYEVSDPVRLDAITLAQRQIKFGLPPFDARLGEFPESLGGPEESGPILGAVQPQSPLPSSTNTDLESQAEPPAVRDDAYFELSASDVINAGWIVVADRALGANGAHPFVPVDRLLRKSIETIQLNQIARPRAEVSPGRTREDEVPEEFAPSTGAILGADEITRRYREPNLTRRIVVTPRLGDHGHSASIDLRLSNRFIIFQRTGISSFNAVKKHNPRAVQRFVERPFFTPFVLHPGEVVLAAALEYVALPVDVGAQVITRSSYGRLGLITATAIQVHPLYRGCLTLELVNLGTVPLTLYPGERVAQLVFFNVQVPDPHRIPSDDEIFSGTYVCPTAPEFPTIAVDDWMVPPGLKGR